MTTLIPESASVPLGREVARRDFRSSDVAGGPLARGDQSAFEALTWLTVGLGVLVTGLAVALSALAIFQ